jgi:hypothetical protein
MLALTSILPLVGNEFVYELWHQIVSLLYPSSFIIKEFIKLQTVASITLAVIFSYL